MQTQVYFRLSKIGMSDIAGKSISRGIQWGHLINNRDSFYQIRPKHSRLNFEKSFICFLINGPTIDLVQLVWIGKKDSIHS